MERAITNMRAGQERAAQAPALNFPGNGGERFQSPLQRQFALAEKKAKAEKINRYLQEIAEGQRDDWNPTFPDLSAENPDIQQTVALILAEQQPKTLLENLPAFAFSTMQGEFKKTLVRKLIEHADSYCNTMLAQDFHYFHANDLEFIAELGRHFVSLNPIDLTKYVKAIEKKGERIALPAALKWEWCSLAVRALPLGIVKTQHDIDRKLNRAYQYKSVFDMKHDQDIFDKKLQAPIPDAFKNIHTSLQEETNLQVKEQLLEWLSYSATLCINKSLTNEQSAEIQKILNAFLKYRAPIARYNLSNLLARAMENPASLQTLVELSGKFKNQLKVLPVILWSLGYTGHGKDAAHQNLLTLLQTDAFQSSKTRMKAANCLLTWSHQPDQFNPFRPKEEQQYFPMALKRQLIQACLPTAEQCSDVTGKELRKRKADFFTNNLQQLDSLLLLCTAWPDHNKRQEIHADMQSIHGPEDIQRVLNKRILEIFQVDDSKSDWFSSHYEAYNEKTRYPNGLLIYATRLHTLNEPEKSESLQAFYKFVGLLLSSDPKVEKDFYTNPDISEQMQYLCKHFPEIVEKWHSPITLNITERLASETAQETDIRNYLFERVITYQHAGAGTYSFLEQVLRKEKTPSQALTELAQESHPSAQEEALLHVLRLTDKGRPTGEKIQQLLICMEDMQENEFMRDIQRLKEQLVRSSQPKNFSGYTVVDTGDPEDRLLANTETPNCNDITGSAIYNKGGINEMINPDERFNALKKEDGKIEAQRTTRLLIPCDPVTEQPIPSEKPVVFLERGYDNGTPDKLKQYLVELAREKAKALGCVLVTKDENIPTKRNYPYAVISLGSPAPWSYIDSGGGLKKNGKYMLSDLRIIETD